MAADFSFEEIEEYLSGTLSPDKVAGIEQEIARNEGLAARVEKHRAARLLVQHHAVQKLKGKVARLHGDLSGKSSTTPWLKIAASLLMVVVVGGYVLIGSIYDSDTLVNNTFSPYPDRFTTMGGSEDNNFIQALELYGEGRYEDAVRLFATVPGDDENFNASTLYTGVSYLALDQPDRSMASLEPLAASSDMYSEAAQWYLALAYVKARRQPEAVTLLEEIVRTEGYRNAAAKELLTRLRSPWRKLPGIE